MPVKFEGVQAELQAAIDSLQKATDEAVAHLKAEIQEAHKVPETIRYMGDEVRNTVAGFRAWLAGKTNGPQIEEASQNALPPPQ